MNGKAIRRAALCIALGTCISTMVQPARAANDDGSIVGRTQAGAAITVRNPATGFTRTVTADAAGNYRFPFLPIGTYELQASKDGQSVGQSVNVTVSLGNATTVNVAGESGATTLETVQVTGSSVISAVDVTSVETATNVTREQLYRLPVERDLVSVALLAPGTTPGDSALGGVSFGGSSVAENSVFINGLNVTDFYNKIGFSSVPNAFYEEYQVKTGGYSVEFGRSTGGVINAVTRSGTNDFKYGAELLWEPNWMQSAKKNRYDETGLYLASSEDEFDRASLNMYASGPIVKDKLFFFAMYEARDYKPTNTNDAGTLLFDGDSDNGFWGTKLDWQISDNHLLSLLAFSDEDERITDQYRYDFPSRTQGDFVNRTYDKTGGTNWALTYSGYLTDSLSMKAMYGENERELSSNSDNDIKCNRVFENRTTVPANQRGDRGCTTVASVVDMNSEREAARIDFEWSLGDHLVRFGLDHEVNTSDYESIYPGPDGLRYDIFATSPGAPLNGATVPAGVTAYVRTREVANVGTFETINSAYYVEDNWSITPNVVLNIGLRMEQFDNKDANGDSYIKIDDMLAPRFGFSWDMNGDGRTKLFGNLGRYFLPVANVINIKQAGPFLDERYFYVFNGYQQLENNGVPYFMPILGAQIGGVDNTQGNGQVGDTRGRVDSDMDPVYQDEAILGFQSMIDGKWSYGVRGTYRRLKNAIDDMNINATPNCGTVGAPGFIMANPGKVVTVWGDTNCDGAKDGWVTVDTSKEGWAMRTSPGNVFRGQRGWDDPKRTYKAIDLMLDRAWDDVWAMNLTYTWARSEGNAEGPVTSDFNFGDSGRTEAFDDPWVNYNGFGYLPNDRRHTIKARGQYALSENWQIGATFVAQSGRPISALGVGNPFDNRDFHSFYDCVANCTATDSTQRVYELVRRGSAGRTPWTYDVGASLTYLRTIGQADLRVKLSVFNLLNEQETVQVDERRDLAGLNANPVWGRPNGFQAPRYGQLLVSVDF